MNFQDLAYLKLILSTEGIGPSTLLLLYSKFRDFQSVYDASFSSLVNINGINKSTAEKIIGARRRLDEVKTNLEKELSFLNRINARIITLWDDEYPDLLRKIYLPPLCLYIMGKFTDYDNQSFAIVGTRQPTEYGKIQAAKITKELINYNITIISGMARGIDSCAHRAAIKNNGRTIAVIGSGLDVIYPPENRKLFYEIIENGSVISEYPLGTKPDAKNFPQRNRIISGLSLGTLVVETKSTGGALQTAAYALDQNREVFALPGNIDSLQSQGTNMLIRKGEAKLIQNTNDILVELQLKLQPAVGKNIPKPKIDLNLFEEKILSHLTKDGMHIDRIAEEVSMSTSECLVHLLSLEFKGLVKQLPGKLFMKL